ncbi:MAG: uroporphyrinogen decarboxylase family protein, partial [Thermofilaceae archaeon]
ESMDQAREVGGPVVAGMPHGFFFQRLYYLRGFTNLLKDFVRKPPQIYELINTLAEYNLELVDRLLKYPGVDVVSFGDDLGTQTRMPISPSMFREFIFPTYRLIFSRVRSRNVRVKLHTDGHVVEVFDQLLETGVNILNIQDRVNGLENVVRLRNKVCVELDIDRQRLIPLGTPIDIEMYVRKVIDLLGSEKGGLMLYAEVHPPTPLENIVALAEALMKYTRLTFKKAYQ